MINSRERPSSQYGLLNCYSEMKFILCCKIFSWHNFNMFQVNLLSMAIDNC